MRNNELAVNNHFDSNMLNMAPSPLQISSAPVLGMLVVVQLCEKCYFCRTVNQLFKNLYVYRVHKNQ